MDPQATLYDLLDELSKSSPDRDEITNRLGSLFTWIEGRKGFLPRVVIEDDNLWYVPRKVDV